MHEKIEYCISDRNISVNRLENFGAHLCVTKILAEKIFRSIGVGNRLIGQKVYRNLKECRNKNNNRKPSFNCACPFTGKTVTDAEVNNMVGEAPGPINFTQMVTLFAEKMAGGKMSSFNCKFWDLSYISRGYYSRIFKKHKISSRAHISNDIQCGSQNIHVITYSINKNNWKKKKNYHLKSWLWSCPPIGGSGYCKWSKYPLTIFFYK